MPMSDDAADPVETTRIEDAPSPKVLTPAARRALAEADARRAALKQESENLPQEFQGPKGPEPTRYGDWETKGIASDF